MKALSIKQPWAWAIVNGLKDVENRGRRFKHLDPLLIHASKTWDQEGYIFVKYLLKKIGAKPPPKKESYAFGALIGEVNMIDCVNYYPSEWFFGPWAYVFKSPEVWKTPIPYRGQVIPFDVPDSIFTGLPSPKCHGAKTFKSGPLAKIHCEWPCPKCKGKGKFTLCLADRILLAIATKLTDIYWKYKIG